jgi:hypothetical protein
VIWNFEEKSTSPEKRTIPAYEESTRGPLRWDKGKLIKTHRSNLSDGRGLKWLSFGFLNTINHTTAFFNFVSDGIAFVSRIKAPNVLIQNIPISMMKVIH